MPKYSMIGMNGITEDEARDILVFCLFHPRTRAEARAMGIGLDWFEDEARREVVEYIEALEASEEVDISDPAWFTAFSINHPIMASYNGLFSYVDSLWRHCAREVFEINKREKMALLSEAILDRIDDDRDTSNLEDQFEKLKKSKLPDEGALFGQSIAHKSADYLFNDVETYKTGIGLIDQNYRIEKGDFIVIGGRPSTGKTSLANQILINMAKQGIKSLYFSLDSQDDRMGIRMLSHLTRMDNSRLKPWMKSKLSDKEVNQVNVGLSQLDKLPIFFGETKSVEIDELENYLDMHMGRHPDTKFIVVDHIGKIADRAAKSLYEQTTRVSGRLMQWTRRHDVTVIALSQLNRASDREDRLVSMADFRESGAIEQDASTIFALYLPKSSKEEKYEQGASEYIVGFQCLKNKDGRTGSSEIYFQGPIYTFSG